MLHYMLPLSQTSPERAAAQPGTFADTGVPLLFQAMYRYGCRKEELRVCVAGGASFIDDGDVFDIGQRNLSVLDKLFARAGVQVHARDVGGHCSRTVRIHVGTGQTLIQSHGKEHSL
jgi:chemotaxis protein CheD